MKKGWRREGVRIRVNKGWSWWGILKEVGVRIGRDFGVRGESVGMRMEIMKDGVKGWLGEL